jgi:hypothetical protein
MIDANFDGEHYVCAMHQGNTCNDPEMVPGFSWVEYDDVNYVGTYDFHH